ncbi:MAG: hypothetical protein GX663_08600 [Clostridiales bacterium]|nr:hypothetical protein [Clostridiales bacterium]
MKYVFVMNPTAGKRKYREEILKSIRAAAEERSIEYQMYFTKAQEDGAIYVRELCQRCARKGEKLRIYACGGDGTINEVINGAFGFENVEVGAVPMGTGNDYIRNYGDTDDFLNMRGQFSGISKTSDLIKYRAEHEGIIREGYCANMFNIGFDCNVVDLTAKIKNLPLISGSLAYLISVFLILIRKKGCDLKIEFEDGRVTDGKLLLIAIANGCYCGGGVKGVPYCDLNDGLMDVSVVNNVSRTKFITIFPSYSKGTHLEKVAVKDKIVHYTKEKALTITANGKSLRLCTDGEITTQKRVEFFVVKDGFKFIVPAK